MLTNITIYIIGIIVAYTTLGVEDYLKYKRGKCAYNEDIPFWFALFSWVTVLIHLLTIIYRMNQLNPINFVRWYFNWYLNRKQLKYKKIKSLRDKRYLICKELQKHSIDLQYIHNNAPLVAPEKRMIQDAINDITYILDTLSWDNNTDLLIDNENERDK